MSDWISRAEAVAIITLRTGLPEPENLLTNAIAAGSIRVDRPEIERGPAGRYPGGMTYVDAAVLESLWPIDKQSLVAWINDLLGASPKPSKGRMPGTGKATTDAPFVRMMHDLMTSKQANSRSDAARMVIAENPALLAGNAEQDSIIRRLRDLYTETYPGE